MKYKIGDEVLVKCKIVDTCDNGGYKVSNDENWKIFFEQARWISVNEKDIYPISILSDMNEEKVWDIAKRLFLNKACGIEDAFSEKERMDIFGTRDLSVIINAVTIHKIKECVEIWEKNKNIKVGDVVEICGKKGIVIYILDEDVVNVLFPDGYVDSLNKNAGVKKTGRHIDLYKILEQIEE